MDVIRIGIYWVAFSLLFNLQRDSSFHLIRSVFILCTVSSAHSLGLLMELIMLLMLYWKHRFSIQRFISLFAVFSVIFSTQYIRNFFQNGRFVADSWTSSPSMGSAIMKDLLERRQLDSLSNILFNGVGSPIFHPRFFGFVFSILLLQIFFMRFRVSIEKGSPLFYNLLMLLMYFAMTLIFTSVGDINLIKNFRYPLTVLPNVVFCIFAFYNLKRQHESK
jgi:hypothetical protein